MDEEMLNEQQWHKKQAISLFNSTWHLIDNKSRTRAQDIEMIHRAHAARYHWGQIGRPLDMARENGRYRACMRF